MIDAQARLAAIGFSGEVVDENASARLSANNAAHNGSCRLMLWNGDRGKTVRSAFDAEARGTGPVRFHVDGHWSTEAPGEWHEIVRFTVNWLAGFGVHVSRPAPLALAVSPGCPAGVAGALEGLRVWPSAKPAAHSDDG